MENLVISIFNTESEAYQSFADLKAFRQTPTTKVAGIAPAARMKTVISLKKSAMILKDASTNGALKGGLVGAVVGLLGGPIGVLFGYSFGSLYGLAVGDTVGTTEAGSIDVVSQKLTDGDTARCSPRCKKTTKQSSMLYDFTKYDTQILRWDVATVVAEVEAALQVQEDLDNRARAQMKAER